MKIRINNKAREEFKMIEKYQFGLPLKTGAVVQKIISSFENIPFFERISKEDHTIFTYNLSATDRIYGLGEQVRGINKRGWIYESYCSDDPLHTEGKRSLYGAHNFFIIDGKNTFAVFIDCPSRVVFDMGYTKKKQICITVYSQDFDLYFLTDSRTEKESLSELEYLVKEFRQLIGRSYIPPMWAFGYQQSRWGYQTEEDIYEVLQEHRKNQIPLDSIYLDIDYMERFKDFTIHPERFKHFKELVKNCQKQHVHLVPIIDAGIKIEEGYDVYEEGKKNGYFCKDDSSDFIAGVWPGCVHFADVLNEEAGTWFGQYYHRLLEYGIDGFWNDMNEPATFYSMEGLREVYQTAREMKFEPFDLNGFLTIQAQINGLANSQEDHKRFYHNFRGEKVRHDKVHNLYGFYMTKVASKAIESFNPGKRMLLFSRASYIGMHRYGGIWTGDNRSWWSHLKLLIQMLPSLNMCGFLYTGADVGGFDDCATEDLMFRWLSFGIFVPLLRNHSALGTRLQEVYQFENVNDLKALITLRYQLVPYLYSEYMKAALSASMYVKPLSFVYREDSMACQVEDELLLGDNLMLAPVYEQNAKGRYVYLPEQMKLIRWSCDGEIKTKLIEKGVHYIEVDETELIFFLRKNQILPLGKKVEWVSEEMYEELTLLTYIEDQAEYVLYKDDGYSKNYEDKKNTFKIILEKQHGVVKIIHASGLNIKIIE